MELSSGEVSCIGFVKVAFSEEQKSSIGALVREFKNKPNDKFLRTLGNKSFWHGFVLDWCAINKHMEGFEHWRAVNFMGSVFSKKKWYVAHIVDVSNLLHIGDVLYLTPMQCKALVHLGIAKSEGF